MSELDELPNNLEAEQAFLGAVLCNNLVIDHADFLAPQHFHSDIHGRIYDAVLKLHAENRPADPVKLKPYFEDDPGLEDVGGVGYLARLAGSAATVINARDYARAIHDLAKRRELIWIARDLENRAQHAAVDEGPAAILDVTEHALLGLETATDSRFNRYSANSAMNRMEELTGAMERGETYGIKTGLNGYDWATGGFFPGNLDILAARPSMGKTACAVALAKAVADHKDEDGVRTNGVGFFSLEMGVDQLTARFLSDLTYSTGPQSIPCPYKDFLEGDFAEHQYRRWHAAQEEFRELPIDIIDGTMSVTSIRSEARRIRRRFHQKGVQLRLLVIDYLQLITEPRGAHGLTTNDKVGLMTRALKSLAKELHIPILALSQLSRKCEERENKHPMLSDLRDSGNIEQDADTVTFLYRPTYYKERACEEVDAADINTIEVICAKRRQGPTGNKILRADLSCNAFRNYGI